LGVTDQLRQARRDALFQVTPESIAQAASRLSEQDNATAILAGTEAVEKTASADPSLAALRTNTVDVPL
jgi:hypothetical protein